MSDPVQDTVKAVIQAQVLSAFNSTPDLINTLVEAAVSGEVKADGKPKKPGYEDRDASTLPFLQWVAEYQIREAVKEAMRDYVQSRRADIQTKVQELMSSHKIADAMTSALVQSIDAGFGMRVDVKLDQVLCSDCRSAVDRD